ncbi:putative transcriptional regulator, TetR family protein [Aeromicrobium flavum]|uniref:Putative transcriptional regulator, TetR family protein n=1 Tax=Aeromicrobium flavum TaxID=416568 RepID=A0A512HQH6_9ACTN|nr:TetR/AcrR family transcriptional regulator [Aeromicrobium flavum]GEO87711.1 putative transcriptional regulator, TetR family protein [Aeromicrobium flavum]
MARTAQHTTDSLLDAAVALFASGGPGVVTMSGVAREAGAPSGSVYHRFPDRASLLAAMWIRTAARFGDGLAEVLGDEPDAADVIKAAVWCVEWCREHLAEAAVLHAGRSAFMPDAWPPDLIQHEEAAEKARRDATARLARSIAVSSEADADEIAFVLLDLPLAVVRPYLQAGRPPTAGARDLVRRIAGRTLGNPRPRTRTGRG